MGASCEMEPENAKFKEILDQSGSSAREDAVSEEWARDIVGREWEIFWKHEKASPKSTGGEVLKTSATGNVETSVFATQHDEDSLSADDDSTGEACNSFEDTWYEGKVEAYYKCKHTSLFSFQVSFTGDDKVYEMQLNTKTLRPSAKAWIIRSKALLEYSASTDTFPNWESKLPQHTIMIDDVEALRQIRENVEKEFPLFNELQRNSSVPADFTLPPLDELKSVRQWITQLHWQIHLRNKLESLDREAPSHDSDPTEAYVSHLILCMEEVLQCCRWYWTCWEILGSICGGQAHEPIEENKLLGTVHDGRRVIEKIITMDTSAAGSKRKRTWSKCQASGTRRTKRRRKMKNYNEFWTEENSGERTLNDDLDHGDFLSKDLVKRLVDQLRSSDSRWFSAVFMRMLDRMSWYVVAPYVKWKRTAEFYLGDRDTLDVEASDGETSHEASDDDESDKISEELSVSAKGFVRYEEIESLVHSACSDLILREMNLGDTVERLTKKLVGILDFADKAWTQIGLVLDKSVCSVPERDQVACCLQSLLDEASLNKDSPVYKVEPLGRGNSQLTRSVLRNALVYRYWLLDLECAENERQRIAFIDSVVSRLSKLPPLPSLVGGIDISSKLAHVAPRVQVLSSKYIDHIATFNRYMGSLDDRGGPDGDRCLMTVDGVREALVGLKTVPVISLAEEMLAIRLDILLWESQAKQVLSETQPRFAVITDLYENACLILRGKSSSRCAIVSECQANASVDAEVREFAIRDMECICGGYRKRTFEMYQVSVAWKEKAENILAVLRSFGNRHAGKGTSSSKSPAMVDSKRIAEMLTEYDKLKVDISGLYDKLRSIHEDSVQWAQTTVEALMDDSQAFAACLSVLENIGQQRPPGVIVDPTRQVLDTLGEVLRWHRKVVGIVHEPGRIKEECPSLIWEGIEILEAYSRNRKAETGFVPESTFVGNIRPFCLPSFKSSRPLSLSKLHANQVSTSILNRMISPDTDSKHGDPLQMLLYVLWTIYVEDYVARSESVAPLSSKITLDEAKTLLESSPEILSSSYFTATLQSLEFSLVDKFRLIVKSAEDIEQTALDLLACTKNVLRECSRNAEITKRHFAQVKEALDKFKQRNNDGVGLMLSTSLMVRLECDTKVLSWLVKTLQYAVLHSDAEVEVDEECPTDDRIPWEVLVGLHDRMPDCGVESGDIACVVLRIKEMYNAARLWQEEISKFTMLSLRGSKRRNPSTPPRDRAGGMVEDTVEGDPSTLIDVDKVSQLSNDPILTKVLMPREEAMWLMLEKTEDFEIQLHDFLGKDYDGACPDFAAHPKSDSLISNDGTFMLYRLTGGSLFQAVVSSIESISKVAGDVLADTPGKATFDWIKQAVAWIQAIQAAVVLESNPLGPQMGRRLVIEFESARSLLMLGESILLNVPEDLRKTLSDHKIYISVNKDRKLTVKSKKGGAHHAVGATVIRWCPFLLEALRRDIQRCDQWENDVRKSTAEYEEFRNAFNDQKTLDESAIMSCLEFHDEFEELLVRAAELIVSPLPIDVGACREYLNLCSVYVDLYRDAAVAKRHADIKYRAGPRVVRNRFNLLDSLLTRREVAASSGHSLPYALPKKQGPFRSAGRILLENSLRVGMESLGLLSSPAEMSTFCAIKAYEIERELFEKYQGDLGESKISPEYREKARALKRSLEDVENIVLCARVLSGDVSPSELVQMPTGDLANPKMRRERMEAEVAAKQHLVLTPGTTEAEVGSSKDPEQDGHSVFSQKKDDVQYQALEDFAAPIELKRQPVVTSSGSSAKQSSLGELVRNIQSNGNGPPPPTLIKSLALRSQPTESSRGLPPPPPPSLAAPLSVRPVEITATNRYVEVADGGGDVFTFSLASGKIRFKTRLSIEPESDSGAVEGIVPGYLPEQGRLRIPEFTKFVKMKCEGGRWRAFTMRLAMMLSDRDEQEYKKFYKDYEVKKRIAMFKLDETAKLFLVTPKFHRSAAGLKFEKSSSTYALLLVREL